MTVQAYVAPGPALGIDATSPVAPGGTGLGVAIATCGAGPARTVTVAAPVPEFVHVPSITDVTDTTENVDVEPGLTT